MIAVTHRARSGMTLMELVVALVVTAMVAALGAATFSTVVDTRTRAREATHVVTSAAATRSLLVSWLSSGRITPQASRNAASASLSLGDEDDALLVIATTSTPISSAETVVHLFIDRDEETPEKGLVAELQSLDVASAELQSSTMRLVQIDSTVAGLLVEYYDEPSRRWVPRKEAAIRSPIAARMTLSAAPGDTLPALLRMPIVQAIPRGRAAAPPPPTTGPPRGEQRGGDQRGGDQRGGDQRGDPRRDGPTGRQGGTPPRPPRPPL